MNPQDRQDYTVEEVTNKYGEIRWAVMLSRHSQFSVCKTLEEANVMATNLNLDPYHYDRNESIRSKTYNNR
jgi:hypothetical protein|tara:strand:+ start:854 stop:1066 length:213 start_codon:yes stop_codon:yes gene_type:complete